MKPQAAVPHPLYGTLQQSGPSNAGGPSSSHPHLPLPPLIVNVEPQHSGSPTSLHTTPHQNELPTYEQLEASFNSVHSGTGLMFQTAALAAQQQYVTPELPPVSGEMADYLSTQEIHMKAMEGTKTSVMMSLVTQCGGADYLDHGGRSPLMYAVLGNQPKICELLLGMGASVNLTDYSGASSILWATYQSKIEVMKVLLRYGADITVQDPDGLTLFHWAVKSPNIQCLKLLCKYATPGIANTPTNEGLTPLHCAVMCNQAEHIKVLLSSTDASVTSMDNEGRTPLTYAVLVRSPQCMKAILSHNEDVINVSDEKGRSPLHYACAEGSVDCVKVLVSCKKCNLHCQDTRGTVPLHWAAAANHPNLIQILLRHGANRAQKDHDGMTALDHALQKGHQKCVEVLQSQHLKRNNSTSSLAGPSSSVAMATHPTLDENGHVLMNMPREISLFSAQTRESQAETIQTQPLQLQTVTKADPTVNQSASLTNRNASVEQPLGQRRRSEMGNWLCSCWPGRHNTVMPLNEEPTTPSSNGSDIPAITT